MGGGPPVAGGQWGLEAKPPAAEGRGSWAKRPAAEGTVVWGRSPQRLKILIFLQNELNFRAIFKKIILLKRGIEIGCAT